MVSTDQSATMSSAAPVEPQTSLQEYWINWMIDELTRRLFPPDETSTTPISNTSRPSALSAAPLVSTPPPRVGSVPVPGTSVATSGMAGTIVLGT